MLDTSRERILREVPDDALVLDIGGWAKPFPRADWVVDMKDYATRGQWGREPGEERFSADTWVQRDVCAAEPLPFEDGQFDFVDLLADARGRARPGARLRRDRAGRQGGLH